MFMLVIVLGPSFSTACVMTRKRGNAGAGVQLAPGHDHLHGHHGLRRYRRCCWTRCIFAAPCPPSRCGHHEAFYDNKVTSVLDIMLDGMGDRSSAPTRPVRVEIV